MCLHDDEILDYTYPPLSTVRMPLSGTGRKRTYADDTQ